MRVLASLLGLIVKTGHLKLIDWNGRERDLGDGTGVPLTLRLHDKRVALEIAWNPNLKFGEAYMDGRMSIEGGTIADVLELFARNMGTGAGSGHMEWLTKARYLARRAMQRNGITRSRKNVATHYDLSGALYDLFLDADKQYSCAFYEKPTDSLETAQQNKKRRIAAKLDLKPGQRILDIGSGWGGMALHLAEAVDADVTGVTLSQEQLKVANDRAVATGRGEHVRFRLEDYRHVEEKFDRVVSVGMFEHVGINNYDTYFKKVAALARRRRRSSHPHDRPSRWTRRHESLDHEIHLPRRLHARAQRDTARGRKSRPHRHRRRNAALALCADTRRLAPPLHGELGRGEGPLRRTLLPHVGVLFGGRRDGLPLSGPGGLPAAARQTRRRTSHRARLHDAGARRAQTRTIAPRGLKFNAPVPDALGWRQPRAQAVRPASNRRQRPPPRASARTRRRRRHWAAPDTAPHYPLKSRRSDKTAAKGKAPQRPSTRPSHRTRQPERTSDDRTQLPRLA